jgi:4-hydroxy-2-oxoheptanedioate aldolase
LQQAQSDDDGLDQRLRKGFRIGSWVSIPDPGVVEAMCSPGLDFLILDDEHGLIDLRAQHDLVGTGNACGLDMIVRVASNDPIRIMQALDAGASGVLVPQIPDASGVRSAISAARYPPIGSRGWGPRRPTAYGRRRSDYQAAADRNASVLVMIERREALADLDAILATPDLGAVLIGPSDLSGALGVLGQPEHASVRSAIELIISKATAAGVPVGIAVGDGSAIPTWRDAGCDFVVAAADYLLLARATDALVAAARN